MKYDKLTRRMFLEGAGKTTLAIPFLSSILPEEAVAATVPKRFVSIQSDYFIARELSVPGYYSSNPAPWTQHGAPIRSQRLSDIVTRDGKMSFIFNEDWNPFVSKLNILSGANAYISKFLHNATIATAASGGTGGDFSSPIYSYSSEFLAEQYINRGGPVLPALRFNPWGTNDQYNVSWGVIDGKPVGLDNAKNLTQLSTQLSSRNGSSVDLRQVTRRKLIDAVLPELKRLMTSSRLSSLDKNRLGEASDRWNDIQNRASTQFNCTFTQAMQGEDWAMNHKQATDVMVQALACNMTRVVGHSIFQGGDMNPQGLHNFAHDARNRNFNDIQKWRAQRVLQYVRALSSTADETGAPLLDNTLLQWTHEFANWGHQKYGYVILTAGGAGGSITTGGHYDLGGWPINSVHVTNLLAMGLSLGEIEKNGRAGFGEYSTGILFEDGRPIPNMEFKDYGEEDVDYWGGQYGKIDRKYAAPTNFEASFTDANRRRALPYLKV